MHNRILNRYYFINKFDQSHLDNVENGGTTNFLHYGIKIKPEIGKTLIWPAEWTHAHSGEILNSGEKHIITGWMNFPYSK